MDNRQQISDLIRKVNWAGLTHAQGEASDVSGMLTDLMSDDAEKRVLALGQCYNTIYFQGMRYNASSEAIPFILYMLQTPEVQGKVLLMQLLRHLAVAYQESYLPLGFQWRPEPQYSYSAAVQSYNAVGRGTDIFMQLLKHEDESVRLHAAFLLGWFPAKGRQTRNTIVECVAAETSDFVKANLLVTLGLLDGYENTKVNEPLLRNHLHHPEMLVRTSAAIALTRLLQADADEKTVNILVDALEHYDGQYLDHIFPWHDGDVVGYVTSSFHLLGQQAGPVMLEPLCTQLEHTNVFTGIEVAGVLLRFFFSDPGLPRPVPKEALHPVQRRILESVAVNKKMCPEAAQSADHFWDIFTHYGLPGSPDELRHYLAA